ncbi:MAG: ABC transporter permease, partial [Candidatus Binatia bacterium]
LQIWFFVTPVMYPASAIPGRFAVLYGLNPMAGAIEGLRWSLLGTAPPHLGMLAASAGVVCLLLASGLAYFRRVELHFADVI